MHVCVCVHTYEGGDRGTEWLLLATSQVAHSETVTLKVYLTNIVNLNLSFLCSLLPSRFPRFKIALCEMHSGKGTNGGRRLQSLRQKGSLSLSSVAVESYWNSGWGNQQSSLCLRFHLLCFWVFIQLCPESSYSEGKTHYQNSHLIFLSWDSSYAWEWECIRYMVQANLD